MLSYKVMKLVNLYINKWYFTLTFCPVVYIMWYSEFKAHASPFLMLIEFSMVLMVSQLSTTIPCVPNQHVNPSMLYTATAWKFPIIRICS